MTAALATAVTVEEVTEVAVTQGAQAFGADAAAVHLVSDDAETLVVAATVGYTDRVVAPGAAVDGRAARGDRRRPPREDPLVRVARRPRAAIPSRGWRAGAVESTGLVPLVGREGPLGLLTLQFRERRPRRREDRALLATIGRQCGQAVERARLYEHERDARELESRLQQLTAAVSGISGVDEIGDRVTAQLATLLGASAGVVVLQDPDGTLPPLATHDGAKTGEQTQTFVRACPWQRQYDRAGRRSRRWPLAGDRRSAGGGRQEIGAIGIELERSDGPVAAELELLEALGRHVAEAIERARLYGDEQIARAAAQRANERLRTLEAVAQAGLAARSLDELIENLLPLVRDLFGADRSALLLADAERPELRMRAAVG